MAMVVEIVDVTPSDFALPDGTVWRRTGSCNRCGECCRSGDPFGTTREEVARPCRMLVTLEDGLHACAGRDSDVYLNGCNVWPSAPDHVKDYPSCSYRFEEVT